MSSFSSNLLTSVCYRLFTQHLTWTFSLQQLKRVRESEKQCKPLLDKNKLLNKRNDDLTQTIQKLEEKLKSLMKENLEMVRTKSNYHWIYSLISSWFLSSLPVEGEDKLPSSSEEAEVPEWPGPSPRWPGNCFSKTSGPGATEYDWWADKSTFVGT